MIARVPLRNQYRIRLTIHFSPQHLSPHFSGRAFANSCYPEGMSYRKFLGTICHSLAFVADQRGAKSFDSISSVAASRTVNILSRSQVVEKHKNPRKI